MNLIYIFLILPRKSPWMNKYFFIILTLFLFGCSNNPATDLNRQSLYDSLGPLGIRTPMDSVNQPEKVPVDWSFDINATIGQKEKKSAGKNTQPIGVPDVFQIGKPVVRTMGADTFKIPKRIPVVDSQFVAKLKESISASPMLMKDNATYNIQYLGVNQGLSSSSILSILEDNLGNLWMGSKDGGVIRYDGTSFETYTEEEGLCHNKVWSMHQDKLGNLWFGTDGGITKYDGEFFINYTEKEGLIGNQIRSIYEDNKGNLWFGTNKGLVKYNGKFFVNYTEENGLSGNDVRTVYGDHLDNIWIGNWGHGVDRFNGISFTNYTEVNGLVSNYVWTIIEDDSNNIWVGTTMGISKIDSTKITNFTVKNGLSSNYTLSTYKDNYGSLWFGTFGGGVNEFNGKAFTHYTSDEGLSNDNIWEIIGDDSGNLWFGTDEGGINKFNQNSFVYYTEDNGMGSKSVRSINEDKMGNLWFGTFGDGIIKYNGRSFIQYYDTMLPAANHVFSILEDKNSNLWFGTFGGGVLKYDETLKNDKRESGFTKYSDSLGLVNNYINTMINDQAGNLWLGTNGGVSKYKGEFFTNYTVESGLNKSKILSVFEDRNGDMWFGTNGGGVDKYEKDTIIQYTKESGLGGDIVNCILEDKAGNLWFGTDGGLSKFNGKYFSTISKEDGLSNNIVQSLIKDQFGNLWVSTSKGLNYIVLDYQDTIQKENQTSSAPQIIVFHKEEGLKSEDFYINSAFLDSKNRIWWGNGGGLTMLDLKRFQFDNKEPQIQLNNIYLQQRYIDYNLLKEETDNKQFDGEYDKLIFSDVSKFNNYPMDLELPYNINHVTFNFNAIDWYAPHQIKYKYKLEGLDQDWSQLTNDNRADYRNIPYGNYTFKVKAIGSANKWSKTFEYSFEINPPWWYTWWAYTIYGLLVLLTVVLIVWLNGRRLIANARELQVKVDDATLEIRRQRDEVEKQRVIAEQQKDLIAENYKEITDSINYAERIQRSFLATKDLLDENLKAYFIFFQPKAVVSGDFYWAKRLDEDNFAFVTADSTGHGVPGAIMSLLNITSIEKAVETKNEPSQILNMTRQIIIDRLKNDGSEDGGKDGMDASLLILNKKRTKLIYSASNNPIWIVRNQELIELEYDKMPIGKHIKDDISFTQEEVEIQPNDMIYTITDGFPDQFGGPKGKKFKYRKLRELILAIAKLPIEEQREVLAKEFNDWKGDAEQVDDVTMVGIRV